MGTTHTHDVPAAGTTAPTVSDVVAVISNTTGRGTDHTLGAILALTAQQADNAVINTAITTVGAGTLTAAALVGGIITRSGSTAAYTDTTATAALIIAALPAGAATGYSWTVKIKNTVAFAETIAAGTTVTLTGQTIIPPNSVGEFLLTMTSATAVSMVGIAMVPLTTPPLEANTAITTVGAGTLTAAG